MKTTIDIPDAAYRTFKAKTSINGEKMRNVVLAFIMAYNAGEVIYDRRSGGSQPQKSDVTPEMPEWAGMARPFITRYPDEPFDNEKMRDEITVARRAGLK
jgi:hypothetical protein